jgi:hypothetical protein
MEADRLFIQAERKQTSFEMAFRVSARFNVPDSQKLK